MSASRRSHSSAALRGKTALRRATLSLAIGMGLSLHAAQATAADLLDIYSLAEQNDQQLRSAEQQRLSVEQNIPIQRADLLPQVGGNAGVNYTRTQILSGGFPGSPDVIDGTGRNLALSLSLRL